MTLPVYTNGDLDDLEAVDWHLLFLSQLFVFRVLTTYADLRYRVRSLGFFPDV